MGRAVLAAVLAWSLASCGGPATVDVSVHAGSAGLARAEVLRVLFGATNASIGDSWHLVEAPDQAVLSERGRESVADCDRPGCGSRLVWLFTASGRGTTVLVFRYCYRSAPANCQPQPDRGPANPVRLTVTVT